MRYAYCMARNRTHRRYTFEYVGAAPTALEMAAALPTLHAEAYATKTGAGTFLCIRILTSNDPALLTDFHTVALS